MQQSTPNFIFFGALLLLISVACSPDASSDTESASSHHVSWVLEDSLTLKSSATDTLYEGWPYFADDRFYLLSFYDYKAHGFSAEGEVASVVGKGLGKGPGETLFVQAMTGVDSLVGLFDNWQQSLLLYEQSGVPLVPLELESTIEGSQTPYYLNADTRGFKYFQGRFYNYAEIGTINHHDPAFYDEPFLAVHDRNGKLLSVSGERDDIYHEHHIPYAYLIDVQVDSFRDRVLISQRASSTWETFDLDGNFIARYGEPGRYITDQDWPDIGFRGEPTGSEQHKLIVDLMFGTPEYHYLCALGPDHVIRSYRRGVDDYEGMMNFLDMPHYLQVYDADGNLLSDEPAPDFYFMPVAFKDGLLWVSLARSYDVDNFSYTLYGYRLVVEGADSQPK